MQIEEYNSLQRKRDTPLERTSVGLCYILTYKFGNIGLRVGIASLMEKYFAYSFANNRHCTFLFFFIIAETTNQKKNN